MPVVALDLQPKVNVHGINWAPNQARTLEFVEEVKADLPTWNLGQEVSYTDPDLGYCFHGYVVERQPQYQDGESVLYRCADNYRLLSKTAARIAVGSRKTSKIKIVEGSTLAAAVTKLTAEVVAYFPGGITVTATGTMPGVDKGGQFIDSWLDDLLKATEGGVAYVDPNAGSEKLLVPDFFASADVTLVIGTYSIINPTSGQLVLVSGGLGESLNGKYKKVIWEGSGDFQRRTEEIIVGVPPGGGAIDLAEFKFALTKKPFARYIEGGVCKDAISAKISINSGPYFTIRNPAVVESPPGTFYFSIILAARNQNGIGYKSVTGKFSYTTYEGPLRVEAIGAGTTLEGEIVEIHEEYFKFSDPTTPANDVNHTALMQAGADAQKKRLSTDIDFSGSVIIHVKGLNASLKIGSRITNFGGATKPRVQSISYDIQGRNMTLDVSNALFEDRVVRAKNVARKKTLEGNQNWDQNKQISSAGNSDCFSNWSISDGDPPNTDNLDKPPGGTDSWWPRNTFDCVNGSCVQSADNRGHFWSTEECEKQCKPNWYCVDPTSGTCQGSDASGGQPNPADCRVNCTGSPTGGRYGCFEDGCKEIFGLAGEGYDNADDCCQNCKAQQRIGACVGGVKKPDCITVVTGASCSGGMVVVTTGSALRCPGRT